MTTNLGVAVITGAGSGLGRALAIAFSERGFTVAGLGRRGDALARTGAELKAGSFHPFVCDVSDTAAVRTTFRKIDALGLPINILVSNAAIYDRFDILERPPEIYMQTLDINVGGYLNCAHAALSRMAATGRGRIINVTSFADISPLASSGAYSVSKGAGRLVTRALVADLADRFPGITITDWIPGALATDMGIADGLAPEVAAQWCVSLSMLTEPTLNGALFDRDQEFQPSRSLKRKLKDLILWRRPPAPIILQGKARTP